MKLVELSCPACGAQMQVNTELKSCVCNFCGKQMIIDDEIRKIEVDQSEAFGYGFEKGRMDVLKGEADKGLIDMVSRIKNHIEEKKRLEGELSDKLNEKNRLYGEREKKDVKEFGIAAYIGIMVALIALMVCYQDTELILKFLAVVGAVALDAFIFYYVKEDMKKKEAIRIEGIDRRLGELENDLDKTKAKLEKLEDEGREINMDIIPNAYRNSDALDYMRSSLASGRAMSINQACALYDEEKRHRDMIKQQQEQMELQRQQIEELRRLREAEADDDDEEHDSGMGKQVAQAALAAGTTIIAGKVAGKVVKNILKNL